MAGSRLDISYRAPDSTGPLAIGDRAPDAPVVDADGKQTTLFDLFRGPQFTRLTFGAPGPDQENAYAVLRPGDGQNVSARHVLDPEGFAFAAYAASPGTSFLIRPDGYVG